jgi:hypothetical protein
MAVHWWRRSPFTGVAMFKDVERAGSVLRREFADQRVSAPALRDAA